MSQSIEPSDPESIYQYDPVRRRDIVRAWGSLVCYRILTRGAVATGSFVLLKALGETPEHHPRSQAEFGISAVFGAVGAALGMKAYDSYVATQELQEQYDQGNQTPMPGSDSQPHPRQQ